MDIKELEQKIIYDISHSWFNNIKNNKKFFLTDSTGKYLKSRKILVGVLLMQEFFKNRITDNKENIATIIPTSVAGSIVNISLLNLGKTICHLNYTSDLKALNDSIKMSNVETLITSKEFIKKLSEKGFDVSEPIKNLNIIYLEDIRKYSNIFKKLKYLFYSFKSIDKLKAQFITQENQLDKTAFILFSSGSENSPKGIMLSHKNIVGNVMQASDMLKAKPGDVLMGTLPIFHSFGLTICTLLPQLIGLSAVYHPDPKDGPKVAELISKYKATTLFSTPTFLRLYIKNKKISAKSFKTLNMVCCGAEKLSDEVRIEFKNKFNIDVYEAYGTTEASPAVSANIHNKDGEINNKIGTVGKALIGTKVIIVNPQTYEELAIGEEGLIMIAGVQIMKGYLGDNTKKDTFKTINGLRFYNTGDRGKIDADGFITIIDRYSRFAKIAGEMISLSRLETEIYKHLEDIEICTSCLTDTSTGEQIALLHTGTINTDTLKSKLTSVINPLFIPKKFIQVEEIPKLGSGKINFSEVKNIAKERMSA